MSDEKIKISTKESDENLGEGLLRPVRMSILLTLENDAHFPKRSVFALIPNPLETGAFDGPPPSNMSGWISVENTQLSGPEGSVVYKSNIGSNVLIEVKFKATMWGGDVLLFQVGYKEGSPVDYYEIGKPEYKMHKWSNTFPTPDTYVHEYRVPIKRIK